ncbi:MAG: MFS transporter [Dehalococcoidia bacterium]
MNRVVRRSVGVFAEQFEVLSVLRLPAYRFFWTAIFIQVAGQMAARFTIGWLAFDLTGSPLYLGYIALFQAVPLLAFGLVGGLVADRFDQRRVLVVTQGVAAAVIIALAVLGLRDELEIWHLLVASIFLGAVQAFDNPSRLSIYPYLLPDRTHLPNAVASIAVIFQMNQMFSPAIAGFLIASVGAHYGLFLTAVAIGAMGGMVTLLRFDQPVRGRGGSPLRNLVAGAQYIWGQTGLRTLMILNFAGGFFGMGYVLLLPAFAGEVFEVDARGLGILSSAGGVGAFFGIVLTPKLMNRYPPGLVLAGSVVSLGLSVAVFSSVPWFYVALPLMVWVGLSGFAYLTSADTIIQATVPDELRGRVMALLLMRWSFVPFGAFAMGALADRFALQPVVAGGGILAVVTGLLAAGISREFRALRLEEAPAQSTETAVRPAR